MNDKLYMKDPRTKSYNPVYVTKLANNYRSHPAILRIPNELYYDGELKVCADEMQRNRFCPWNVKLFYILAPQKYLCYLTNQVCTLEFITKKPLTFDLLCGVRQIVTS